jgi:hypothetical protein
MEGSNNSSARNSRNSPVKLVIGILIFIAIVIGLYYLYNFLYGSSYAKASVSILDGTIPATKIDGTSKAVKQTELTGVMDGGEYSASFWVYVSDTKGFPNSGASPALAHLLDISDDAYNPTLANRKKTLLFVGLNPKNGSIVIRQSTGDNSDAQIINSLSALSGTSYPLGDSTAGSSGIIDGYNSPGATYTQNDKCDIANGIEYQRWSLITVVGNGRTLDVYIDGKLSRSCVYKGYFSLGNASGKATATFGFKNGGNLKGFFSNGQFYNYALSPDQVWSNYQAGPGGGFNVTDFFSNLFNINVSFQTTGTMTPA